MNKLELRKIASYIECISPFIFDDYIDEVISLKYYKDGFYGDFSVGKLCGLTEKIFKDIKIIFKNKNVFIHTTLLTKDLGYKDEVYMKIAITNNREYFFNSFGNHYSESNYDISQGTRYDNKYSGTVYDISQGSYSALNTFDTVADPGYSNTVIGYNTGTSVDYGYTNGYVQGDIGTDGTYSF